MIILILLFLFKYSIESKEADINYLFKNNIYELKLLSYLINLIMSNNYFCFYHFFKNKFGLIYH